MFHEGERLLAENIMCIIIIVYFTIKLFLAVLGSRASSKWQRVVLCVRPSAILTPAKEEEKQIVVSTRWDCTAIA